MWVALIISAAAVSPIACTLYSVCSLHAWLQTRFRRTQAAPSFWLHLHNPTPSPPPVTCASAAVAENEHVWITSELRRLNYEPEATDAWLYCLQDNAPCLKKTKIKKKSWQLWPWWYKQPPALWVKIQTLGVDPSDNSASLLITPSTEKNKNKKNKQYFWLLEFWRLQLTANRLVLAWFIDTPQPRRAGGPFHPPPVRTDSHDTVLVTI